MFFPAHEENQSLHLPLKDAAVPVDIILLLYTGRQARFCPLGVYQLPDR
jgi:electron-transferring-flavoprotein dehydrogenase